MKKCDWPRASHWTDDFYRWLKRSCYDYNTVEQEVGQLLNQRGWTMLSDKKYMRLQVKGRGEVED